MDIANRVLADLRRKNVPIKSAARFPQVRSDPPTILGNPRWTLFDLLQKLGDVVRFIQRVNQ